MVSGFTTMVERAVLNCSNLTYPDLLMIHCKNVFTQHMLRVLSLSKATYTMCLSFPRAIHSFMQVGVPADRDVCAPWDRALLDDESTIRPSLHISAQHLRFLSI